jgi:Pyruvate/2-oxoacid:ferredoxin oxidoreductase delta subunit
MTTRMVRKIVRIDEDKCTGCGLCTSACAEGALALVDGKARLISEKYCDGLAACLSECPEGAISIIEREAEEFDEAAAKLNLAPVNKVRSPAPCACPGSAAQKSMLENWPVQLALVPPGAPFLAGADVSLVADCVPFAYADFHRDFAKDHSLLVACPKLDDYPAHLEKLTAVLRESDIKSLTVVHMEVPCCFGLVRLAKEAIQASGKDLPFTEVTVGMRGQIKK